MSVTRDTSQRRLQISELVRQHGSEGTGILVICVHL